MVRIGIVTHYYNSQNYGGLLQAYALTKYLNVIGKSAEQISLSLTDMNFPSKKLSVKPALKYTAKYMLNQFFAYGLNTRKQRCAAFRKKIPHSENVYSSTNVCNCIEDYDIFITGSDQVWNMDWFFEPYFLTFVPEGKRKVSYAASIGKNELTESQREFFKKVLEDFFAISVRERDTVELLTPLAGMDVKYTLDPTLLLDSKDWDEISSPRLVNKPYVFCYFLGRDKRLRKIAKQYALKNNLKLVTIPHLQQHFECNDMFFGDEQFIGASPEDFISLIKYSDCVLTDSFHASVFSCIYKVPFFTFQRKGNEKMGNRIKSLTELFGCPERFCDIEERFKLQYLMNIKCIEFGENSRYLEEKDQSRDFLKKVTEKIYED